VTSHLETEGPIVTQDGVTGTHRFVRTVSRAANQPPKDNPEHEQKLIYATKHKFNDLNLIALLLNIKKV